MNMLRILAAALTLSLASSCTVNDFLKAADSAASGYYGNRYREQPPAYHPAPTPVYYPNY